jgi:hypothetical protein
MADGINPINFRFPLVVQILGLLLIFNTGPEIRQQVRQFFQYRPGITNQRQAIVLAGIKLGHVDVDKAHIRVLELGLGGGGEVAVAGADTDHQVSIECNTVGGQCTGCTDRAQVEGMIVAQAALARHGLADRDAGGFDKCPQRPALLNRSHRRPPQSGVFWQHGSAQPPAEQGQVGPGALDMPYPLAEERLG